MRLLHRFQPHRLVAPIAQHQPAAAVLNGVSPGGRCNLAHQQPQDQLTTENSWLSLIVRDSLHQMPHNYPRTFYRRVLPTPPAVQFSSDDGKRLFAQALADGTMEGFFKLIEQFRTQDEPAFCGLASLAMVLNSLSIDPRRQWKGPWRDFHEAMLDCCHPLSKVAEEGVTLQQVQCLAKCNGADATMLRQDQVDLARFRALVLESCRSDQQHMIVSYSRKAFSQTGDGHFSPVGGYHAEQDLVLILDTARFKYPPHWVPLPLLHEAMRAPDPVTQQPRGLLLVKSPQRPNSVLFTIDRSTSAWLAVASFLDQHLPALVAQHAAQATDNSSVAALIRDAVLAMPRELPEALAVRQSIPHHEGCSDHAGGTCTPTSAITQLLHELRASELFKVVCSAGQPPWAQHGDELSLERAAMLLWLATPAAWAAAEGVPALADSLCQLLKLLPGSNMAVEVAHLQAQLAQAPLLDRDMERAAACRMCSPNGCSSCAH